jgi:hypothetical protein
MDKSKTESLFPTADEQLTWDILELRLPSFF